MSRALLRGAAALVCLAALTAASPAAASVAPSSPAPRIIGGVDPGTSAGYVTALLRNGRFICSGSVIAPTKVLTAAHCLTGSDPATMTVLTGKTNLADPVGGEAIPVTAGVVNPDYGVAPVHDVAVLTLAHPTSAPSIPLASPAEDAALTAPGARLAVSGFGRQNPIKLGRPLIGRLRQTTESVRHTCPRIFGVRFIPASVVCTQGKRIRRIRGVRLFRSVCSGDSGGPLVASTPAGLRQVGVVSQGVSLGLLLCGIGAPDLFARVAGERGFIDAAAFGTSAPAPIAQFTGPGVLRAGGRISFPLRCQEACTLSVTLSLAVSRFTLRPQTVTGTFAGGETAEPFLTLNRSARLVLRRYARRSALKVEVTATTSAGATETRTRLFGFHR